MVSIPIIVRNSGLYVIIVRRVLHSRARRAKFARQLLNVICNEAALIMVQRTFCGE